MYMHCCICSCFSRVTLTCMYTALSSAAFFHFLITCVEKIGEPGDEASTCVCSWPCYALADHMRFMLCVCMCVRVCAPHHKHSMAGNATHCIIPSSRKAYTHACTHTYTHTHTYSHTHTHTHTQKCAHTHTSI